jgi:hypothetical protein
LLMHPLVDAMHTCDPQVIRENRGQLRHLHVCHVSYRADIPTLREGQ